MGQEPVPEEELRGEHESQDGYTGLWGAVVREGNHAGRTPRAVRKDESAERNPNRNRIARFAYSAELTSLQAAIHTTENGRLRLY